MALIKTIPMAKKVLNLWHYNTAIHIILYQILFYMTVCRVYSNFTLETILATAFGRRINLQRGESDQFSKSMELLLSGFTDGQFEQFVLFHSKFVL